MWRNGRLYYRQRVPTSLLLIVGKREIWRSLGTDSPTVALRRSHEIAASIERYFEVARSQAGLPVDHKILSVADARLAIRADASSADVLLSLTLREVYDTYMTDPTRDWSPRTRMASDDRVIDGLHPVESLRSSTLGAPASRSDPATASPAELAAPSGTTRIAFRSVPTSCTSRSTTSSASRRVSKLAVKVSVIGAAFWCGLKTVSATRVRGQSFGVSGCDSAGAVVVTISTMNCVSMASSDTVT